MNLEIFGAGGYAQVRDLRRAVAPLGSRARFWGFQTNVGAIYPRLDYLMTGLPEKEALNLSKVKAENMIAFLFGGRAAEELVFKDITTGAGNDIERATDIARRMVCEWGMSEKLGPLAYEKREGPVFLGMSNGATREYSESKAEEIDAEVLKFDDPGYKMAKKRVAENMDILHG